MKKAKQSTAPSHLKPATAAWWDAVVSDFELEQHHVRLLTLCAAAWDRAEGAREIIDRDGMTFNDRFGQPKCRPEVLIERDSRALFARLLRELALDVAPPPESRPPRRPGTGA